MLFRTRTRADRSTFVDTLIVTLQALAIAMLIRVFFYQPFNIPSGSMKDTLLVGDYLFVSKLSYGYSRHSFPYAPNLFSGRIFSAEPKRGDVAVFKLPIEPTKDYIKRVIGIPGDEIAVRRGIVVINGTPVPRVSKGTFRSPRESDSADPELLPVFEETLPNGVKYRVLDTPSGALDTFGPFIVPAGHYFVMGDNRDNSTDSRVPASMGGVGPVPLENFVGRAEIIFFSANFHEDSGFSMLSPIWWMSDVRWSRVFNFVR